MVLTVSRGVLVVVVVVVVEVVVVLVVVVVVVVVVLVVVVEVVVLVVVVEVVVLVVVVIVVEVVGSVVVVEALVVVVDSTGGSLVVVVVKRKLFCSHSTKSQIFGTCLNSSLIRIGSTLIFIGKVRFAKSGCVRVFNSCGKKDGTFFRGLPCCELTEKHS